MTAPARAPDQVERPVLRVRDGDRRADVDRLAVEEPLEIRLLFEDAPGASRRLSLAVTMRTPGDDFELAAGFLLGEGLVSGPDDLADISWCVDEDEPQRFNIVNVTLAPGVAFDESRLQRNFYTTSSCGICGKASIEAVERQGCDVVGEGPVVAAATLAALPETLRARQAVFERTGGLHAAGLFSPDGRLIALREDVGRHNAVDKLIGQQLLAGAVPLGGTILVLSGRASFELVQKAVAAGIPIVAAVGAPSSLAVDLADQFGVTLAGFVRGGAFNLYAHPQRVQ